MKLVHVGRRKAVRMPWTNYRIFRQEYPQGQMDKIKHDFWAAHYPGWTEEQKHWDWQPVEGVGIPTVIFSGYYLDGFFTAANFKEPAISLLQEAAAIREAGGH